MVSKKKYWNEACSFEKIIDCRLSQLSTVLVTVADVLLVRKQVVCLVEFDSIGARRFW